MKIENSLFYGVVLSSLIILGVFLIFNIDEPSAACPDITEPEAVESTGVMPKELVSSTLPMLEGSVDACFNYDGQIYVLSSGDLYEYAPAMFIPVRILPIETKQLTAGSFVYEDKIYLLDEHGYLHPYDLMLFLGGTTMPIDKPIQTELKGVTGISAHYDYAYTISTDGYLRKYYMPELLCGKTISRSEYDLGNEASYAKKLSCFTLTDYIAFLMSGHRYHEYLVEEFSKI